MTDNPASFVFSVSVEEGAEPVQFQEVSGLDSSLDTEEIVEGGENRFVHQLPDPARMSNIELKRGIVSGNDNALLTWCKDTIEHDFSKTIQTKQVTITLRDANDEGVANWTLTNAWPVRWRVDDFDAMENKLAIGVIELACSSIKRIQ